jgi:hypothetical protein
LNLSLSVTEASGDYFYYITDATNNYERVIFVNTAAIPQEIETDYNFTIRAIDFSGNVSEPKTVSVTGTTFVCNNLLLNKTLTKDNPYFAPGWTPNTNYTFDINNNDVVIALNDATYEAWQAQFPVLVNTPVTLTPGNKYALLLDIQTSKNLPFYVKFFDGNDNVFMEIPRQTVTAPGKTLSVYDIVCPTALTQISKILFDFGGNATQTQFTISNISICGEEVINNINDLPSDKMSVSFAEKSIQINSLHEIATVNLYNASGQTISVNINGRSIDTSLLENGIYILRVQDVQNNQGMFKVMIK